MIKQRNKVDLVFVRTSSCSDSAEKTQICPIKTPQRLCFISAIWLWSWGLLLTSGGSNSQNSRGKNTENHDPACPLISGTFVAVALCGAGCLWAWGAISDTRCQNTHQTLCTARDVHAGVCTHLYAALYVHTWLDVTGQRPRLFLYIYCHWQLAKKDFTQWHWIFPSGWLKRGFPCARRCVFACNDWYLIT